MAVVSSREGLDIQAPEGVKMLALPAEKIALDIIGKPFSNTVLLGAFSKASGAVRLESVLKAVEKRFSAKPEILKKNLEAVKKGYDSVA